MRLGFEDKAVSGIAPSNAMATRWLSIVGIGESGRDGLSPAAIRLIDDAVLVVGGVRHLTLVGSVRGETMAWKAPFAASIPQILRRAGEPVCVLASGDPFWFGAGAVLAQHIPPSEMLVLPAPSTFSLAAARLGWPLQSALTLGLHVERPEVVLRHLHHGRRLFALSLDGSTPGKVAKLLARYGFGDSIVHVMEALGGPREIVTKGRAADIADEAFGPLNVIAMEVKAEPKARAIPFVPGLPDDYFEHDGQITKREIRAITLSALKPAPGELLWDIGLGAGSVAIEWLLSHHSMRACGFEKSPERAARAARNAAALGVPHLEIHQGSAPESLAGAPSPDAIFIGGDTGNAALLETAWHALRPGGRLVGNAVTLDAQARLMEFRASLGGSLTRISVEREGALGNHLAWRPAMPVLQWVALKPWS